MKKTAVILLILSMFMITFPLLSLKTKKTAEEIVDTKANYSAQKVEKESFKVLFKESQKIEEMSNEDYIFSVVAAEVPANFEVEAIKAQAVAAYSFALRRKAYNNSEKKDYDISADPKTDQSYISLKDARTGWGSKADEYEEKIRKAVKEVLGVAVLYKDEVALTLYHATSCGKTEAISDIFGGKADYLVSRDSVWDKLAPTYLSTEKKSLDDLKKLFSLTDYKGKAENFIKITEKTKNGTIKRAELGGKEFSGEEIREKLSLKSMNFVVKASGENIIFTVYGYGHGVGMSQNGANYLAKQGYDYKEILKHYYKGVTIKKVI